MQTLDSLKYNNKLLHNQGVQGELLLFSIIFLLNPLLGIISLLLFVLKQKFKAEQLQYGLYFLIATYMGLINSTKTPEGDFLRYKQKFELASSMGLFEYVSSWGQEPVYSVFNYLSNIVFMGEFKLFVILFTFIIYFLIFISIHKYWRNSNFAIFGIVLIVFYHNFFFSTANLVRQVLAGSIFLYFLIERIVAQKIKWWLIVIAVFIHSSSAIPFLLTFIPTLTKKLSLKNLLIMFSVALFLIIFGNKIINLLNHITSGLPAINYLFKRYNNMDISGSGWYHGAGVNYFRKRYIIIFFITLLIYHKAKIIKASYYILNFVLAYIVVLEIFAQAGHTYMQMRMIYYLYMFIPFVYPYIFYKGGIIKNKMIVHTGMILMLLLFIVRFFSAYNRTTFEFPPVQEILFNSVFSYF